LPDGLIGLLEQMTAYARPVLVASLFSMKKITQPTTRRTHRAIVA